MGAWRLLDTGARSAAENVALDEAILRARAEGASPDTVRLLQYSPPAVLIGYHQSPSQEIRLAYCREHGIDLGRRITGGGAILFDAGQLGWEVIARRGGGGLPEHHAGLYPVLCGAVAKALGTLGVEAKFRPRNDIEVGGRKISGTGGVEEGNAFLFQGTLLVDFDLEAMMKALRIPVMKLAAKELDSMRERVTWLSRELGRVPPMDEVTSAVAGALSGLLGAELEPGELTDRERELVDEILPRTGSREWLYRIDRPGRERGYLTAGRRTEGGTIRVDAAVDARAGARGGRIQSLVITGDFFCRPRRSVLDLEARFKDLPAERERVAATVDRFLADSGAEFMGVGARDIAGTIWDAVRKGGYVRLGFAPEEADRVNVAGGDLLSVLDRGATRLLLPYCAKKVGCERRHEHGCERCGGCRVGEAYDLGEECGLAPVTITSFEDLEQRWREMARDGTRAYVGACCEQFFTKHRREFEAAGVPGVLVDLESATCYDLGRAREAHEGTFEGHTELRFELLEKVCRLAAERRKARRDAGRPAPGEAPDETADGRARGAPPTALVDEVAASLGDELAVRLERAREAGWRHHGRRVTFYLPGMIRIGDRRGRYPAVSITGKRCELGCAHCAGRLLETMPPAETPGALVDLAKALAADGALGVLVSGGSDACGRLPWDGFLDALREVKETTPLELSVHAGLVDPPTAEAFARAGVDAALFDVIGSEEVLRDVFHLEGGLAAVESSLDALVGSGVRLVPHVVIGFHGGGERRAVEMIAARKIGVVSFVIFMPLRGTALEGAHPPELSHVADVLAFARERMPGAVHSLGCARPRDRYGERVEAVALMAGVERLAVPTDGAETAARELGLEVDRQETCCSVDLLL